MKLRFTKMHGAGNDFVVLDATHGPLALSEAQYRFIADRRFGIGADQILIVEPGDHEYWAGTYMGGAGVVGHCTGGHEGGSGRARIDSAYQCLADKRGVEAGGLVAGDLGEHQAEGAESREAAVAFLAVGPAEGGLDNPGLGVNLVGAAVGGIAVDSAGNASITGYTTSTNFPVPNALQTRYGGGARDAFVAKLNNAGSGLIYSTYLGGGGADIGWGIAVDAGRSVYLAGLKATGACGTPTAKYASTRRVPGAGKRRFRRTVFCPSGALRSSAVSAMNGPESIGRRYHGGATAQQVRAAGGNPGEPRTTKRATPRRRPFRELFRFDPIR